MELCRKETAGCPSKLKENSLLYRLIYCRQRFKKKKSDYFPLRHFADFAQKFIFAVLMKCRQREEETRERGRKRVQRHETRKAE